jgi:hypothetical protein
MYKVFQRQYDNWYVIVNALDSIVGYSIYKDPKDANTRCEKLNDKPGYFTGQHRKNIFSFLKMVEDE